MAQDDEIRALRTQLARLQLELGDAQAALTRLERAIVLAVPEANAPAVPVAPVVAPTPPVAPITDKAVPPPLPWQRAAATPPPVPVAPVAASSPAPTPPPVPVAARTSTAPFATPAPKKRRAWGPPEGMSLETAIGTWWLPRIGIAILSLGVVYLVTLAAQWLSSSWFMPYLRIGGGYAVCAVLLVAAKRLEATSKGYARVLASGGFALSYFVTFAAHFISDPPVIASQALTGVLLFGVVLTWGGIAQRRQSRLLALGVTLLGHFTIFLSLNAADTAQLFSLPALFLFSLGSAFFLVKNRWYSVGAAGMVCTYVNLAVLLNAQVFVSHSLGTLPAVMIIGGLYLIYALAELFAPESLRRRDIPLSLRSAFVTANTVAAIGLGLLLWNDAGMVGLPPVYWLYATAGVVVLVIARVYLHLRAGDPLYNIYQIKGLSLLTLALAHYLESDQLAVALAVEALVLLLNAAATGFIVSRVGAVGIAGLSVVCLYAVLLDPGAAHADRAMWIVFFLLHAAGVVYLKTDWRTRSLQADAVPAWSRTLLKQCDLLDTPPDGGPFVLRVGDQGLRAAWPLVFSLLASVGWVVWLQFPSIELGWYQGHFTALLGLALLAVVGVVLRAWSLTLLSPLLGTLLMSWVFVGIAYGNWQTSQAKMLGLIACILFGLSELSRLSQHKAPELWWRILWQRRGSAHVFAALGSCALICYVLADLPREHWAYTLAALALFFAIYTAATNAVFWQCCVVLMTVLVGVGYGSILALAMMSAVVVISQTRYFEGRPGLIKLRQFPIALWLAACLWQVAAYQQVFHVHLGVLNSFVLLAVVGLLLSRVFDPFIFGLWALASVFVGATAVLDTEFWGYGIRTASEIPLLCLATASILAGRVLHAQPRWPMLRLPDIAVMLAYAIVLWVTNAYLSNPLLTAAVLAFTAAFLAYAVRDRLYLTGFVAIAVALLLTFVASVDDVLRDGHTILGPIATTGAAMLFWALCEWGLRRSLLQVPAGDLRERAQLGASILALAACGLLLLTLYQIDLLANFYLTIAWTMAAVAMLITGALNGQAFYRYGGLATFALVIGRAAVWDTRNLEPVVRVVTMMLLGAVLLVVAYGYIRARGKAGARDVLTTGERGGTPREETKIPDLPSEASPEDRVPD